MVNRSHRENERDKKFYLDNSIIKTTDIRRGRKVNWRMIGVLVAILAIIFGLIGAGWSQRPIIDYKIDRLDAGYATYYNQPMSISIKARNRGNIDALLYLVVTVTNANITVNDPEPWMKINGTQSKFIVTLPRLMENYVTYTLNINPIDDSQNFTIRYTIEDMSSFTPINGMISRLFLEPHGSYPIYALYNRTDVDTYRLVK